MKVTKTCNVGGILFTMVQDGQDRTLTMKKTLVPLEEVRELVTWLQQEVLGTSTSVNPTLVSFPSGVRTPGANSLVPETVAQFPAFETRKTDRLTKSEVVPIESALRPGEVDPYADRKANGRGKYPAMTSIPRVDMSGVELGGGYVEQPIKVKL